MRLSLAVLVSGSLLLSGCGGEESSPSSKSTATPTATATATPAKTATGPSEKEWKAEVTAVCKRNQKASRRIAADAQSDGLQGKELVRAVLRRSAPVQRRLLEQMDAIEAPAEISGDYNFFVERLEQAVPLLKQLAGSLENKQALAVLQKEFKDVTTDTRPFALEHDLKACLPDQS